MIVDQGEHYTKYDDGTTVWMWKEEGLRHQRVDLLALEYYRIQNLVLFGEYIRVLK